MLNFLKNIGIKVKKIELKKDKQYLYMFEENATQHQIEKFRDALIQAKKGKRDLIVNQKVEMVPVASLRFKLEHAGFKNKKHLLKTISKGLGKKWINTLSLEIDGSGFIKVEKIIDYKPFFRQRAKSSKSKWK